MMIRSYISYQKDLCTSVITQSIMLKLGIIVAKLEVKIMLIKYTDKK